VYAKHICAHRLSYLFIYIFSGTKKAREGERLKHNTKNIMEKLT